MTGHVNDSFALLDSYTCYMFVIFVTVPFNAVFACYNGLSH